MLNSKQKIIVFLCAIFMPWRYRNFKKALSEELKDKATQSELQVLLADLLEELKLNYVQNSYDHDPTKTLSEVENLELKTQKNSEVKT